MKESQLLPLPRMLSLHVGIRSNTGDGGDILIGLQQSSSIIELWELLFRLTVIVTLRGGVRSQELELDSWYVLMGPSNRTQMLPFSPILYETSRGSIHIVSSSGNSCLRLSSSNPHSDPAFKMIGSILWLILIHLYPDPLKGFSGNQCF